MKEKNYGGLPKGGTLCYDKFMPHYCAYSFTDLFKAAYGRGFTQHEAMKFTALSQPERNDKVRELAGIAGWQCQDVPSYEGEIFTAFWPPKSQQRA